MEGLICADITKKDGELIKKAYATAKDLRNRKASEFGRTTKEKFFLFFTRKCIDYDRDKVEELEKLSPHIYAFWWRGEFVGFNLNGRGESLFKLYSLYCAMPSDKPEIWLGPDLAKLLVQLRRNS